MTENRNRFLKMQCDLFKGTIRDIFIGQKMFDGSIQNQVEDVYQFILRHINLGADIKGRSVSLYTYHRRLGNRCSENH